MTITQRILDVLTKYVTVTEDCSKITKLPTVCLLNTVSSKELFYNKSIAGKVLVLRANIEGDYHLVINDIVTFVNEKLHDIDLVQELLLLEQKINNEKYQTTQDYKTSIRDIKNAGFSLEHGWIYWRRYIPIDMIMYKGILHLVDAKRLKDLDYGVTSFRVANVSAFREVEVKGMHPQCSFYDRPKEYNPYCIDMPTCSTRLATLCFLRGAMSQINLDHCYDMYKHIKALKPLLEES